METVQAVLVGALFEDWPTVLELGSRGISLLNRTSGRVSLAGVMNVAARALISTNAEAAAVLQGTARRRLATGTVNATRSARGELVPLTGNIGQITRELHARGEAMDDDQAIAYALDAIAKAQVTM